MSTEKSSSTLAQIGPIVAPLGGALVAILLIVAALMTNTVSESAAKVSASMSTVSATLGDTAVTQSPDSIPLADSVAASFNRDGNNSWKAGEGSKKLLGFPIRWQVELEAPKGDAFAEADEDKSGYLDPLEYSKLSNPPGKFEDVDRNKDAQISREEFETPPVNDADVFKGLDKNSDGVLTAKDGEITPEEEYAWDTYPFQGGISEQEYLDRFKPKQEKDLGPVVNVEAKLDPATMEIVITWDDPAIADKPEDIAFMVARRAPQTVEKRKKEHNRKLADHSGKLADWDNRFRKWWNDPTPDADGKTNKEKWPKQSDAEKQFEKSNPKPVRPAAVSEWEDVTELPVTGNEHRDPNFDLDVTYTYAVYMATQKNPKRNAKARVDSERPGWFFYPDRQVAAGHPVLVRNRLTVSFFGSQQGSVNLALATWYKHEAGDVPKWYRAQITETVPDGMAVGAKYRASALKGRVKLFDTAGTDVPPEGIFPTDNTEIDFDTRCQYIITRGEWVTLSHATLGDFQIPKETKAPATEPQKPAGTGDKLEVRCLGVKGEGKEGIFEITRWHNAGDEWLQIVQVVTAKKGAAVGAPVQLSAAGRDFKVWDAAGNEKSGTTLPKDSVDMSAGTYDGITGRTVTVGGDAFDIYGTLYKQ